MLYNTAFRSAEAFILVEPDQDDIILTLDPNQQKPLVQNINPDPQDVIVAESRSAVAFIPEEMHPQSVI